MSERSSPAREVAVGSAINLAGNLVGLIEPLFLVAVSRLAGAPVLGSFILATTYVTIAQRLVVLGLDKGLMRHVPMARAAADEPRALAAAVGTAFRTALGLALIGTIAIYALAELIVDRGGGDAAGDGGWWLGWLILVLPADALRAVWLHALRGASRMAPFVAIENGLVPGLLAVLGVPALALGLGLPALIAAYLAASYLSAFAAWRAFRRQFPTLDIARLWSANPDRALLAFSAPQGLTELMNYLLGRIDVVMIAAFFPDDPELVAVYAMASLLAGSVKKVRQAFDTSLAPVLARLIVQRDHAELGATYRRVSRWVLASFLWVAVGIGLGAPSLLAVVGPVYVGHWPLVPVLCAARLVNAAVGPAQAALLMAGRSRLELINSALINAMSAALNAVMIPRAGVYGAAVATAIALSVFSVVRAFQVRALLGIAPSCSELARIAIAAALAAVPAVWLLSLGVSIATSAVAAAAYAVLYPAALFATGAGGDLRAAWRAARRRREP